MAVYKRGRNWYIDYRYPPGRTGKRIRERVGPVKEEAVILLSERLKDIRHGRNPELRQIRPRMFGAVVEEFLEKHASLCRDPLSYRHKTQVLLRAFKGMMLQEITTMAIEDFIAGRLGEGISRPTANRLRAVLSKIFNWAINRGYYGGANPVRNVRKFAESPGRVRFLSGEEAERLITAAPEHLRPVIIAALHTGGRRREVLSLKWEDIDIERGVLYFDQTNTKSGKQREVPIDRDLEAVLREMKNTPRLGPDPRGRVFTRHGRPLRDIRTAFEAARERASLGQDVTFHTMRHTFGSWFMINGGDLYRLQKYLGHSTITLTQRYAHLSPDYLKDGTRFFGAPAVKAASERPVDTNGKSMASSESTSR
jgi:integrase